MNIEIHASNDALAERIWDIIVAEANQLLPQKVRDNTGIEKVVGRAESLSGKPWPYIRVYSDDRKDYDLLHQVLKRTRMPFLSRSLPVECLSLAKYFEVH